jgi:hypothetical protein
MGFTLDKVVPWGRTFEEYVAMFDLAEDDLRLRILGCGDGPAGFNATLTEQGGKVVSCDPIYGFDAAQIASRISVTYDAVMAQLRENRADYVWRVIPSVEALGEIRMVAMSSFLLDFEVGKLQKRYVVGELPSLPFDDGVFDIALSSHFLFLYSDHLSAAFHLRALREMLRVAREVRVFPLLTLDGKPAPYVDFVVGELARRGFNARTRRVSYEFQRGGNEMLIIAPEWR